MRTNRNGGFTLVELLVTIVAGSIVTLAATTVLLLGLRLNHVSSDTASRQNTTRIVLSVLEDMATEGSISKVVSELDSWQVLGTDDAVLLSYDSASGAIYTGNSFGTPLMEGVIASYVSLDDKGLMTVAVETEDGTYTSSVYCRTTVVASDVTNEDDQLLEYPGNGIDNGEETKKARIAFLKTLASQRGSPGVIVDNNGNLLGGEYYSKWYNEEWSADTPWCACFLSWALKQVSEQVTAPADRDKWYANVDYFMAYFKDGNMWKNSIANSGEYTPVPGDLIFFDWDSGTDPEHVGAVLAVTNGYVYTIEGNTAGIVAVRRYKISDSRIIGYGILDWEETPNTQ